MTEHTEVDPVRNGSVSGYTPYAQIPKWVLRAGKDLSAGAVRLYGVIMSYADNRTHFAWPSHDTLSADMGVSVRSVYTYMKELENMGAVIVDRRRNPKTGNYYSNGYTLRFDDPREAPESPSEAEFRRPPEADFPRTTPNLTTPTPPPSGRHHPSGDDQDSSLRSPSAAADDAHDHDLEEQHHLRDLARQALTGSQEEYDAFTEYIEDRYPLARYEDEGFVDRLARLVEKRGLYYGTGKWARVFHNTHR